MSNQASRDLPSLVPGVIDVLTGWFGAGLSEARLIELGVTDEELAVVAALR